MSHCPVTEYLSFLCHIQHGGTPRTHAHSPTTPQPPRLSGRVPYLTQAFSHLGPPQALATLPRDPVAPPLECVHPPSRATPRESQPPPLVVRARCSPRSRRRWRPRSGLSPMGGATRYRLGSDPRYFVSPLVAAAAAEAARPTFFPPHRPPSGHFSPLLTLAPPRMQQVRADPPS